eukprot:GHVU01227745.1.p1 GENE.GHVU01227745.1~~GHVU01227745.1.p1  ORF type:complete len:102 (+),score=10.72 GHVU01227745.1:313-618(+)
MYCCLHSFIYGVFKSSALPLGLMPTPSVTQAGRQEEKRFRATSAASCDAICMFTSSSRIDSSSHLSRYWFPDERTNGPQKNQFQSEDLIHGHTLITEKQRN